MELSKRLAAIAEMVGECESMADIGTDHGYIPIYLIEQKKVKRALAMDVKEGPLERAKEHIRLYGLDEYIELRLSDGAKKLKPSEVEVAVVAGMGGRLMMRIVEESREVFHEMKFFVLQPQSEHGFVRRNLAEQGYEILAENMVCEDGKYYPMMKVKKGRMKLEKECFYEYGEFLLKEKNPCLQEYLKSERSNYTKIMEKLALGDSQKQKTRLKEMEQLLVINKEALQYYKEGEKYGM